jgi:hypothetical protein
VSVSPEDLAIGLQGSSTCYLPDELLIDLVMLDERSSEDIVCALPSRNEVGDGVLDFTQNPSRSMSVVVT